MASLLFLKLHAIIFISALCLQAEADSVLFLNTTKHPLLRPLPFDESDSILLSEVGAAVSILLGSTPPASVPPTTSLKLSQFLLPNPFDRPRAMLLLEVGGVTGQLPLIDYSSTSVNGAMIGTVVNDSDEAEIEILDEDALSVILLDDYAENNAVISDGDLDGLATWLGGSYVGSLEGMDGVLTFPLTSGKSLNLHMSKEADHDFAAHLFSLVSDLEVMLKIRVSTDMQNKLELLQGCFKGIQALQEEYGPGSITEQAMEVFMAALIKSFNTVQEAYKGQIVGVLLFIRRPAGPSRIHVRPRTSMEDSDRPHKRQRQIKILLENEANVDVAQPPSGQSVEAFELEKFSRDTAAWISGILLLVALFLGVTALVNMPVTRDTLLYTNVKVD